MDSVKNEAPKEQFVIDDELKADWAFGKLTEINRQLADKDEERKAYLKAYKAKLDRWYQSETHDLNQRKEDLQLMIEGYASTQPDGNVKTPSGQAYQTTMKKYNRDDEQLSDFMRKEHPEFMKGVKWQEFKATTHEVNGKIVDENGEVVPGITVLHESRIVFRFPKVGGIKHENK